MKQEYERRQSIARSLAFNLFARDIERWPADKSQLADVFALAHTEVLQKN